MSETRDYEVILIVNPELNEEAVSQFQAQFGELVVHHQGKISEWFSLGKRKLSHKIGKVTEGLYLLARIQIPPSEVNQLQRGAGLTESIVRMMVLSGVVPMTPVRHEVGSSESRLDE